MAKWHWSAYFYCSLREEWTYNLMTFNDRWWFLMTYSIYFQWHIMTYLCIMTFNDIQWTLSSNLPFSGGETFHINSTLCNLLPSAVSCFAEIQSDLQTSNSLEKNNFHKYLAKWNNISPSPRFPWNSRGPIPLLNHHSGWNVSANLFLLKCSPCHLSDLN